uniref:NADH-ubiquinone oxidoreductase chain 4L n=1 Tax=Agonita chinensis TaxID=2003340 RepID=A0A343SEN4_9CUCU|nr:NADH dehydrogenase subunit 4L [Agonita chinensis]
MKILFMLSLFMFVCGLIYYFISNKHFLHLLLSLEFMFLSLYFMFFLYLNFNMMNLFIMMIFLTMGVCEGVLGLCLMVQMIRTYSSDFLKMLSMLW